MSRKSLISIRDFTKEEILHVLETAKEFEQNREQNFLEGKVIALELTGVGTVTDPVAAQALMATLLDCAEYESSGSITSKKALLVELDNGLVLQMNVKGDRLAGCGVWSCPEFFEAFDELCD